MTESDREHHRRHCGLRPAIPNETAVEIAGQARNDDRAVEIADQARNDEAKNHQQKKTTNQKKTPIKKKPPIKKMFKELSRLKFLKRPIVFVADVVLSVSATLIAYIFMLSVVYGGLKGAQEGVNTWNIYASFVPLVLKIATCSLIVSCGLFYWGGIYREIIRHFAIRSVVNIILIAIFKSAGVVIFGTMMMGVDNLIPLYAGAIDLLLTCFFLIGVRSVMVTTYYYLIDRIKRDVKCSFIYSTRGRNPIFAEQLNKDTDSAYRIRGFLTTNHAKVGSKIAGQRVYDVCDDRLEKIFETQGIQAVIFTSTKSIDLERDRLVEFCINHKIKMMMVGDIEQLDNNGEMSSRQEIKAIQIEDLLERPEINIDTQKISHEIQGQTIMVTGAAGSIGSEIVRQVAGWGAERIIALDVAETPIHNLSLELGSKFPNSQIKYVLGDIRSMERMRKVIKEFRPSIIFHAAAYKHVPLVEGNPCEGVLDNVWGTVNVALRAMESGVKKFVMVSTDKAVNPTNVMGATKRIAEMCVQDMNRLGRTEFITTRFGNVLGSNGSVIPLFKSQIAQGGPVTVTHPDIIRYFMTIPEACRLVLQAATMGHAGEILVFDMGEQVRIVELARKMIRLSGFEPDQDIEIKFTGLRPGEKLYEELLSCSESTCATQHQKIRIAQTPLPERERFSAQIKSLILAARRGDIEQSVIIMKSVVPEFRSNNSEFERYDT